MNTITRFPKLSVADGVKVCQIARDLSANSFRIITGKHGTRSVEQPVVLNPFMLPGTTKVSRQINRLSLDYAYNKALSPHASASTVLLTTVPATADFLRHSRAAKKIYYCVDDWSNYPGLDAKHMEIMEDILLRDADGLIFTSRRLAEKNVFGRPAVYLPHGVDFSHFNHEHANAPQLVEEMESIPKPIVGFFGLVSEWVDLELVAAVAKKMPSVSFVLIGKPETDMRVVSGIPNIYNMGAVPYLQLPHWARYFNIGIIPFKINALTEAVNPLKLYEYYALGIPVVSTALPEVVAADGPRLIAENAEEYVGAVHKLLYQDSKLNAEFACKVAQQNTWDERASTLLSFVADLK